MAWAEGLTFSRHVGEVGGGDADAVLTHQHLDHGCEHFDQQEARPRPLADDLAQCLLAHPQLARPLGGAWRPESEKIKRGAQVRRLPVCAIDRRACTIC